MNNNVNIEFDDSTYINKDSVMPIKSLKKSIFTGVMTKINQH